MSECKTITLLQQIAVAGGNLSSVARSALGLIEDMRHSGCDPMYLPYLHELVEHIYQIHSLPLPDHLHDDMDCDLCTALIGHVQ